MVHFTSIYLSSLLLLLGFFSPSFSLPKIPDDLTQVVGSNFPSIQAEKLIRGLNLFPHVDFNIDHGGANSSLQSKKIFEKPLRFPNFLGDSESQVSVEDLGHHAGYYQIQHSHAGR